MRKILQIILLKPVLWFADKFSSRPVPKKIFKALSKLKKTDSKTAFEEGPSISFDVDHDRFIVFSINTRVQKMAPMTLCFANPIIFLRWIL
jgi:hypothetical protein